MALVWSDNFAQTAITTYYDSTNQIVKEKYYILKDDSALVHGEYKMFGLSGEVLIEGNYDTGKRQGLFVNYYPNGNLQRETIYKDGIREGTTKVYDQDGSLIQEAVFQNDTLSGDLKLYNTEGQLIGQTEFQKGKPQGLVIEYFPGGGKI